MALQVWLPFNGSVNNNGLSNLTINSSNIAYKGGTKFGQGFDLQTPHCYYFTSPEMAGATRWSFCFWAYINSDTSFTTNWQRVFAAEDIHQDTGTKGQFRFEASYASDNIRSISTHNNATYATVNQSILIESAQNTWVHCAVTCDGKTVRTYKNGVRIGGDGKYLGGCLTGYFLVGGGGARGIINDLRIYNNCISLKEIEELSKGLFIHYPLNQFDKEPDSTITLSNEYDTSGFGNKGFFSSGNSTKPVLVTDSPRNTGSYKFNGTSTCIDHFSSPFYSKNPAFTIACWMKPAALGATYCICTSRTLVGSGIALFKLSNNKIRFDDGNLQTTFDWVMPSANTWYHICVTRDSSSKKLYINGTLQQTVASVGNLSDISSLGVIGASESTNGSGYGTDNWMNGLLSDFRIYATALTATQVADLTKTAASITDNGTVLLSGEMID